MNSYYKLINSNIRVGKFTFWLIKFHYLYSDDL